MLCPISEQDEDYAIEVSGDRVVASMDRVQKCSAFYNFFMVINSVEQFLEYWERVRFRTRRVAVCIPPEKLEWTYAVGKFTLGDLVRHLAAIERHMFVECVMGRPSKYPGHGRELADGYEAVLAYLDQMDAQSIEQLRTLTPQRLQAKCTTTEGSPITVWKWLRSMAEHEIHHRGQIYLYLSMLGVPTPPLYGLTSEQVRERSAPMGS